MVGFALGDMTVRIGMNIDMRVIAVGIDVNVDVRVMTVEK